MIMKGVLYCITIFVFVLTGCAEFEEPVQVEEMDVVSERTRSGEDPATFDTLPNPYALEVMQDIYDTYSNSNKVLQPTDLYVRFLPQDSLQLDVLRLEYGLELFEYPLDLNIA